MQESDGVTMFVTLRSSTIIWINKVFKIFLEPQKEYTFR